MDSLLQRLNKFLGRASFASYAGSGSEADPSKSDFISRFPGFKEYEYQRGPFYYRDSYAGYFTSAGQEVVFHNNKPLWVSSYGGGMKKKYHNNENFTRSTFTFLKEALSTGEKQIKFQPRGPRRLKNKNWEYFCNWTGDITAFKGNEEIRFKGRVVFTHDFFGGLIKWRE